MIEIPIFKDTSSDFTQNIELDNLIITIRLVWNIRCNDWFISIETSNGNKIDFIRLVFNYPIINQYKYLFPDISGDFFVQLYNNINTDTITYNNLGKDLALYYYTESEVDEWKVENGLD